jgi:hypothetical protein
MSKTIYKVEASPSGREPHAAVSPGDTPRRRTLLWVLVGIVVVILAMIVAIVALNAVEGDAMGATGEYSATATHPGSAAATVSVGGAREVRSYSIPANSVTRPTTEAIGGMS